MRKNQLIVFDLIWYEAIKELPDYERTELYEAIFEYALTGRQPERLTGHSLALWKVISARIPAPSDDDTSDMETDPDKQ